MFAKLEGMKEGSKVRQNRKENNGYFGGYTGLAIANGKIQEFISVRFYWPGRHGDSPCYCCVWISGENAYGSGGGKAGGYGYDKKSEAMEQALTDAGIELWKDADHMTYIGGVGSSAMEEAIKAIGGALGYKDIYISSNHA